MTLSSILLERLDLAAGTVWTWLPPEIDEDVANMLYTPLWAGAPEAPHVRGAAGFLLDEKASDIYEGALQFLQTCLTDRPASYLVFEDRLHHPPTAPTDFAKWTEELTAHVTEGDWAGLVFYPERRSQLRGPGDGEVYSYVTGPNRSLERIDEAMVHADSGPLKGVLTTRLSSPEDQLSPGQWITRGQLELMADGAELVLVGAYDGDSYVAWSRT